MDDSDFDWAPAPAQDHAPVPPEARGRVRAAISQTMASPEFHAAPLPAKRAMVVETVNKAVAAAPPIPSMIARPEEPRAPGTLPNYAQDPIPARQLAPAAPTVDRSGTPRVDPRTGMTIVVPIGSAPPANSLPVPVPSDKMQAGFQGAAQGLTAGFADELAGAANVAGGGGSYTEGRDSVRKAAADAERLHSTIFGVSKLAGSVVGAVALPVGNVAKGAGWAAKAANTAVQGGVFGGVTAAGESTADLTKGEVKPFLKDVAAGTAGGAVTSGGLSVAGSALSNLSEKARGKAVTMMRSWFGGGADAEAGKTTESVRRKATGGKVVDTIDYELTHDPSAQEAARVARTNPAKAKELVDQKVQSILAPRTQLYEKLEGATGKVKTSDYNKFIDAERAKYIGKNTGEAENKLKLLDEMKENATKYWGGEKGEVPWLDLREHVSDLQKQAGSTIGAIAETERKGMADWRKSVGAAFFNEQMDQAASRHPNTAAVVDSIRELNDRFSAWKGMGSMLDQRVKNLAANGWKERATGGLLAGQIGAGGEIIHGIHKGDDIGTIAGNALKGEAIGVGVGVLGQKMIEPVVKGMVRNVPRIAGGALGLAAHIFGNPIAQRAGAGLAGGGSAKPPAATVPPPSDDDVIWDQK